MTFTVVLAITGSFASAIAPHSPTSQDVLHALQNPSGQHWLGTDTLGRDVLSRLLYGIGPTFYGGAQALIVFLALGVPLGIVAGYKGGWADTVISKSSELLLSIPPIIIVLVVVVIFPGSTTAAMTCLGILGAPGLVRVVRAASASVREQLYVVAARVAGVSELRIMSTHVLRRILGPVLVQATLFFSIALVFQATLSFLGLTSTNGHVSWGAMVGEASQVTAQSSWLLVPSGVAILLAVLCISYLGDVARDLVSDAGLSQTKTRASKPSADEAGSLDWTAAPEGLLTVENLHVTTDGGLPLVTGVSFGVRAGEVVGLVGESGCGKSVTSLAVLGLLPPGTSVTAGTVTFHGQALTDRETYKGIRGSGMAYISQDPMAALDPVHSIGSHLLEVVRLHHVGTKASRRARALQLLEMVQIRDPERVLAAYPHQISGGMAQRVAIAIALAGSPKLLIADEPTTALDVTVQADILGLLRRLQQESTLAVLLITHDWGVVADLCDSAVVMYAGEVVERAPVTRTFSSPSHPYTQALLAAEVSHAVPGALLPTVPGRVPAPGAWPSGCRFASRCPLADEECTQRPIRLTELDTYQSSRCVHVNQLVAARSTP